MTRGHGSGDVLDVTNSHGGVVVFFVTGEKFWNGISSVRACSVAAPNCRFDICAKTVFMAFIVDFVPSFLCCPSFKVWP